MSRTDMDPATLANALRRMAGDGSIEWVMEPIQASVLLDVADALGENDKLRELVKLLVNCVDRISNEDTFYYQPRRDGCGFDCTANGEGCSFIKLCEQARELGVEVTS